VPVRYRRDVPSASSDPVPGSGDAAETPAGREVPGRRADSAPSPWSELAASGWRPSVTDVRRGFAGAPPGRVVTPLVTASRSSAILVLVFPDGPSSDDAHVVFIERSRSSGTHRGDIAFPGGVLQAGETPVQAALRETEEEIGVPPDAVEIIASLDMVATQTAFLISPFVGVLESRPTFVVDRAEVERVLVVPLADLVREGAHWLQPYTADPESVQPYFTVGDAVGWGTTGALLIHLLTAATTGHLLEAG
jgi:8-oxo-dGTP pyrophosphatase MutT (NUDIX family)